jgi:hypothetical protein
MYPRIEIAGAIVSRRAINFTAVAAALLMMTCAVVVGRISLDRQYFNVDTETDFLGAFMPDAERLASGQPLLLLNHPAGYPAALALARAALGDWLTSGLLLSWLSTIGVLLASHALLRRLGGRWVALGGLAALAVSDVFLAFGAQAASDVPFLALWMAALALTAAALDSGGRWLWPGVGLFAGLGLLTRSTGLPLTLLVLAPLLTRHGLRSRVADAGLTAAGLAIPVGAWLSFAVATGSPVAPTENYPTLALAYADGRVTGDTLFAMRDRFSSGWQVIASDPLRLLVTYLKNLLRLPLHVLTKTTWPPLAVLGAALLPLWLLRLRDPKMAVVFATALGGVLLTNLNPVFEARYYLFLVPLLGASAGYAVARWLSRPGRFRFAPACAVAGLAIIAGAGLMHAVPHAQAKAEHPGVRAQLAEAVPAVRRHTPPGAILIAYKDNLAFHTGRRTAMLPPAATIAELCAALQTQLKPGPAYIYIGYVEQRRHRVELSQQLLRPELPPWLSVAAQGTAGGGWRLLEVLEAAQGDCQTSFQTPNLPSGNIAKGGVRPAEAPVDDIVGPQPFH